MSIKFDTTYRHINQRNRSELSEVTSKLRRANHDLKRHLSSHELHAPDPALECAAKAIGDARRTISGSVSSEGLDRLARDVFDAPGDRHA
jgi:hypothetical protein